jgi:hypothetical protein
MYFVEGERFMHSFPRSGAPMEGGLMLLRNSRLIPFDNHHIFWQN